MTLILSIAGTQASWWQSTGSCNPELRPVHTKNDNCISIHTCTIKRVFPFQCASFPWFWQPASRVFVLCERALTLCLLKRELQISSRCCFKCSTFLKQMESDWLSMLSLIGWKKCSDSNSNNNIRCSVDIILIRIVIKMIIVIDSYHTWCDQAFVHLIC